MSVLDRIQQVHEKKKRHESAVSNVAKIVMALPTDERAAVMADIIALIDAAEANELAGVEPRAAAMPAESNRAYVDIAHDFIKAHPEGVRTRDVAKATGQDVSNVDGTLRTLLGKGLIVREKKKRLWLPATGTPKRTEPNATRVTIRDMIVKVYSTETGPLSAKGIYEGVQRIKPEINRSSVDGEIMRMKAVRLLNVAGRAPHGGSLYALSGIAPSVVLNGGNAAN